MRVVQETLLKKVPVNANYNEIIYDQVILPSDYVDVSKQMLGRLEFQLQDLYGNIMDLNDNYWSFSLLFTKVPEEYHIFLEHYYIHAQKSENYSHTS